MTNVKAEPVAAVEDPNELSGQPSDTGKPLKRIMDMRTVQTREQSRCNIRPKIIHFNLPLFRIAYETSLIISIRPGNLELSNKLQNSDVL
jgi:hypothetical protein